RVREPLLVGLLLVDAGGLALAPAQVIELGPPDGALPLDLDPVDDGRVEREHPLDADSAGDLANGEGLARAAAPPGDHDAGEHLDTLLLALAHLDVHADRVAGRKGRYAALERRFFQIEEQITHGFSQQAGTTRRTPRKRRILLEPGRAIQAV